MKIYDNYYLLPALTEVDNGSGGYTPLDYTEICQASRQGDMKPLDEASIRTSPFGFVMIGTLGVPGAQPDVLSYAAVTGFEEYMGQTLAVVGGVITLPHEQKKGHAMAVVSKLLEVASADDKLAIHGHQGFMARCNAMSVGLFGNQGFSLSSVEEKGKVVMVKQLLGS